MTTREPTNAQRAAWAVNALAVFTGETYCCDHPDTMDSGDLEDAIGDLICDLLHLAARKNMEAAAIHQHALDLFDQEVREEESCDCAERSWYGAHHDTQCPASVKQDTAATKTEHRHSATSAPDCLNTLLDIKRLAEKSGDHEADPFALLDLIADEARSAINKATKP